MPPKKRAMAEADPNAQAASGPGKKNKKSAKSAPADAENAEPTPAPAEESTESEQGATVGNDDDDVLNRPPYVYYCIARPFFDRQTENFDKDAENELDEDEMYEQYADECENREGPIDKPAADFPQHKWIAMWRAWTTYADWKRRTTYTNPDNFDMYVYNDFHSYGIQELIENLLVDFDKEFKKTKRDEDSLKKMWVTVSGMILWLLDDGTDAWIMNEDGDRVATTYGLIGRAFISTLNELDLADQLGVDSEIKDLGLVMSLYLEWGSNLEQDFGFEEGNEWRKAIPGYAKKAGIDLASAGCYGIEKILKKLDEEFGTIESLAGDAKADRWAWKKHLAAYKKSRTPIGLGGDEFNILKWSRKERAAHNFNNKDPLKDFPEKALREGNIMLA